MKYLLVAVCLWLGMSVVMGQNVGIGTSKPQYKLDVMGDRIYLHNDAETKFFFLRTDGDEIDITTFGSHFWITAEDDKHIILNPNNASMGNIGIGTDNPTEKLHVAGGARFNSLQGTGNRLLYASPTGIVFSTEIDVTALQETNALLLEKVTEQAQQIQVLIQRIEALENAPN